MKLNNFESFIDQKILARGREYFKDGRVLSVEEIGNNEYEAEVEGTELYTVEVELDDEGNIIDTACGCPYDMEVRIHPSHIQQPMQNRLPGRRVKPPIFEKFLR